MKNIKHLLWAIPTLILTGLWLFENLLNEIRYFGLAPILSLQYPWWFYAVSIASVVGFVLTVRFLFEKFRK